MMIGGLAAVALLLAGRFILPRLFAQAARTKSPELFLSACLLVVIVASLVTSAIGFSAVLGRPYRRDRHRGNRLSGRS
jgi:CPA2 family monovalent cation:H+ antiporter-2